MKIIRLKVSGLDLFENEFDFNWIAQQNVNQENNEGLFNLFSNIYAHNVLSLIGINASGKSSTLKIIASMLDIFLASGDLNSDKNKNALIGENIKIESYYFTKEKNILKLESHVRKNEAKEFYFFEEIISKKPSSSVKSKNKIFEFSDAHILKKRSKENIEYLKDDITIFISELKKEEVKNQIYDLVHLTNFNFIVMKGQIPVEVIKFLDPSIEYVKVDALEAEYVKSAIRLKFVDQPEEITVNKIQDLQNFLSSGTIKGINIFAYILRSLRNSGYLIVDELENHFNKSIVRTIINLFRDSHINPNGASLIFSTHYPELLDEFDRNDSIYVTRKQKKINLSNLSSLLKRNDFKKSEVYQSDYLGGTAPDYEMYMNLKDKFMSANEKRKIYNE